MAKARVTTSHTYNEGEAEGIAENIYEEYSVLLKQLDTTLGSLKATFGMGSLFE